jgi:uncharacterized ferredoxin-like protein
MVCGIESGDSCGWARIGEHWVGLQFGLTRLDLGADELVIGSGLQAAQQLCGFNTLMYVKSARGDYIY